MEKYSQKDVEWLLNLHKDSSPVSYTGFSSTAGWKRLVFRIAMALSALVALIILPFFLLIRFSVYLNLNAGLSTWPSLIGGIAATIGLLLLYLFLFFIKMKSKRRLITFGLAGVSGMVLGYSLFSLFYLSGVHAKKDDVKSVYRSMHPILRVAVTTATLADHDLVITDIARVRDDYERMGLPVNQTSYHYRQESGYVHAVDIRTLDRGFIRNAMLQGSLELMGFETIRHKGTADHLHVALRPADSLTAS